MGECLRLTTCIAVQSSRYYAVLCGLNLHMPVAIAPKKVLVGAMSPVLKDSGYLSKLASHRNFHVIMCELYYTAGPARKWKIHQVGVVSPSFEAYRK